MDDRRFAPLKIVSRLRGNDDFEMRGGSANTSMSAYHKLLLRNPSIESMVEIALALVS